MTTDGSETTCGIIKTDRNLNTCECGNTKWPRQIIKTTYKQKEHTCNKEKTSKRNTNKNTNHDNTLHNNTPPGHK